MERKRITCPETAHIEEIEYDRTPHGLVIAGCSRFAPSCAVACTRECARRLDVRDRVAESRDRVLVVFSRAAWTRPVASALAELLVRDGLFVELADADAGSAPPPADYDAVVIGTPQRLGRLARGILEYIQRYRDVLAAMPAFWFAVGPEATPDFDRMHRATGWMPSHGFGVVRPSRRVRWLGDPNGARAQRVRELALAVGDNIPARELETP